MNFAVRYVSEVNSVIDRDGTPLVQKSIGRYGLTVNTSGFREVTELFQHLQDIIKLYPMEFAGCAVQ